MLNDFYKSKFIIIVYADDILLLLTQSISDIENLMRSCENELHFLDMKINAKNHLACGWVPLQR